MKNDKTVVYIRNLLRFGIQIEKGEVINIQAPIESFEFIRKLVEEAYKMEAKYVGVEYYDHSVENIRLKYSNEENLEYYPKSSVDYKIAQAYEKQTILKFSSGVNLDKEEFKKQNNIVKKSLSNSMFPYTVVKRKKLFKSCSSVIPTKAWAKQVYEDLSEEEALNKLWEHMFDICKCNEENPSESFLKNINSIVERRDFLNNNNFDKLHFYNDNVDLNVKLAKNHFFSGIQEKTVENVYSMPNYPTEEIFTANDKFGVNGYINASLPVVINDNLVYGIRLEFKDGKLINYTATKGYEHLLDYVNKDEGNLYVGEIAILQGLTSVKKQNIVFKNTLLDENAGCHLALGYAYPISLKEKIDFNKETYEKHNLNFSMYHCDITFGSEDINVDAYDINNKKTPLISNGVWQI